MRAVRIILECIRVRTIFKILKEKDIRIHLTIKRQMQFFCLTELKINFKSHECIF